MGATTNTFASIQKIETLSASFSRKWVSFQCSKSKHQIVYIPSAQKVEALPFTFIIQLLHASQILYPVEVFESWSSRSRGAEGQRGHTRAMCQSEQVTLRSLNSPRACHGLPCPRVPKHCMVRRLLGLPDLLRCPYPVQCRGLRVESGKWNNPTRWLTLSQPYLFR